MARKPSPPAVIDVAPEGLYHPPVNPGLAEVADEHNRVQANVIALADQLGYDGSLAVGSLEDEIRFYQRRSVEALLAVGTRLILLKEQIAFGEFTERIRLLGFSKRTAQRFMQAAIKTSKSANLALLAGQIEGAGKFLELITLDDDDLAALNEGGTVAGLTLDDVERMSNSELKAALREARENEAATGRVLQEKNARLDQLAAEVHKRPAVTDMWDSRILGVTDEIAKLGVVGDEVLGKHVAFIQVCEVLADALDPEVEGYADKLEQARVPIARLGEQLKRWGHVVARLQFEYHTKVGGYLDQTHLLPPVDGE